MRRLIHFVLAPILAVGLMTTSFIILPEHSIAGTTVSGSIVGDTNWTIEDSPYFVINDIVVEENATLTVEAGVQVFFEGTYHIHVNGTLRVLGRSDRDVLFMPQLTVPLWEGISVHRAGHLELRNSTLLWARSAVNLGSEDNIIAGSYFEGEDAVHVYRAGNIIESNTIVGTLGSVGIHLGSLANNTTIQENRLIGNSGINGFGDGNTIENNYLEATVGIEATFSNSTIRGNVFRWGLLGISLATTIPVCANNEIHDNWIEGSAMYAIWLICTGSRVWNNTFIGNPIMFGTSQAVDELGVNHWNESYPIGGNYWSDYGGPDMFSGPGQNIPGSDGIGDVPYPIYDSTFDYYPLVDYTPPMPDLVVNEGEIIFDPPDPVQEGDSVDIYAAVRNTGMANASNVVVRFFDGDPGSGVQIDGDQTIGLLPLGGGKEWVKVTWTAQGTGQHDICVVADPDDIIKELNEDNNQACASIEVVPAGPPLPPTDLDAHLSGSGFENVTIIWSLSPDDSGGKNSVVRYDIYRAETYSSNTSTYQLHDSVLNGTSEYLDAGAGEGDSSDHFLVVCAVSAANDSSCSSNQAAKFTRPLSPGPSLVSIPLIQSDESTETVLQTVEYDKAWYYDSPSGEWKWYMKSKTYRRELWSVNHTMGIWVNVTQNSNLTVAGVVPAQTTIHLHEGWNLVSFPSFNSTYTVADLKASVPVEQVEAFDSSSPPYFLRVAPDAEVLLAGQSYWMKVSEDTVWVVSIV